MKAVYFALLDSDQNAVWGAHTNFGHLPAFFTTMDAAKGCLSKNAEPGAENELTIQHTTDPESLRKYLLHGEKGLVLLDEEPMSRVEMFEALGVPRRALPPDLQDEDSTA